MIEKFIVPELDEVELQSKISHIRYPNELEDESVGWKCGTPSWAVRNMMNEWKTNFCWKKSRDEIKRWQHYQTRIEGLKIHFIHELSAHRTSIPIILLHGWPSTFYEFHKIIEPLRDHPKQSFDVIVPSLPGYGFSEAPKTLGSGGIVKCANIAHKLMLKLDYDRYLVYGTDLGAVIGTSMSQNYPDHVIGFLTNMPMVTPPLPSLRNILLHPISVIMFLLSFIVGHATVYGKDTGSLSFTDVNEYETTVYKATKFAHPYTLAYGLSDSPIGLVGWMLEPYHGCIYNALDADHTNIISDTITVNEFLTQVTIYWITNTMSSSYRTYYEYARENNRPLHAVLKVPFAVSYFKYQDIKCPQDWIKACASNLVQFRSHSKGGQFPALEQPSLLLKDIRQFGSIIRKTLQN